MKYFLTIAASDNSGGAGIQQDLKTASNLGYWGLSAITGITVQNFEKVEKIYPTSADILKEQIEKNIKSFEISATKIGAVCSNENIVAISSILKKHKLKNVVLDTVLAPTKGKSFLKNDSVHLFKEKLLPLVDIITPNKDELALLSDKKIGDFGQAVEAATKLSIQYGCAVYLTGGHFDDDMINEAFIQKDKVTLLAKEKLNLKYTHGTGCTFSTALSCFLGKNHTLLKACEKASEYVSKLYQTY